MWRLKVEMAGREIESFPLKDGETVVGRSRHSDVQVNAPDISRSHAKITVSGGVVTVENMGKAGTRIDGAPLDGAQEWKPGQRVAMGALAQMVLERGDEAPASARSGAGETAGADEGSDAPAGTLADADRTADESAPEKEAGAARTAAAPAEDAAFRTSLSANRMEGDEEGHTRAMQTRMVSPEELDALRDIELKRVRKRMTFGLAVAIPVLALLFFFRPRPLPPETEIDWPRDPQGRALQTAEPAPGGGADDGGFDVLIPGAAPRRVAALADGLQAETGIGRAGDVPLRLILRERTDGRFVQISREAMVAEWMEESLRNGDVLSFDRPYDRLGFYGFEQGVPFTRVPYQRQEGDTIWHGVACLFRHGERRYSLKVELPAAERVRAERMLHMRYVKPSTAFERSHWESDGAVSEPAALADRLAKIRREMVRVAPLTWVRLERLLQSTLVQAAVENDPAARDEALEMLVDLREQQARWFNSQTLARDNARAQGDEALAFRIAELAKSVFSHQEDRRYFQVRRW